MAAQISKSKVEVILVEDSEDDAFFFDRCLTQMGRPFEYIRLKDGADAKAYLQTPTDRLRLVFLDLKLPGINGFEFMAWLRAQPFCERVQIVILSGSDNAKEIEAALNGGASDFLVKPVRPEMLNPKLGLWLER